MCLNAFSQAPVHWKKTHLYPMGNDCLFRQKNLGSTHALLVVQVKFICVST